MYTRAPRREGVAVGLAFLGLESFNWGGGGGGYCKQGLEEPEQVAWCYVQLTIVDHPQDQSINNNNNNNPLHYIRTPSNASYSSYSYTPTPPKLHSVSA